MSYFEGFIVPVPEANKDAYRKSAADAAPMFLEFGVDRHFEAWDSDVPEGKITLTNLRSRRARAQHEASDCSYNMSELHLASRPLVSRCEVAYLFGLARLACHFDDM